MGSSYLLADVVLEEDLLDLGGDHVGVQAAGQGRHLIQTRGRCVKKLGYLNVKTFHNFLPHNLI